VVEVAWPAALPCGLDPSVSLVAGWVVVGAAVVGSLPASVGR
jgi:hypothetical protein